MNKLITSYDNSEMLHVALIAIRIKRNGRNFDQEIFFKKLDTFCSVSLYLHYFKFCAAELMLAWRSLDFKILA
jgi:hypothetical protein